MTNFSKPINRALFVLCVIVTGSIAGAFVWAFFFLMDKGIELFWAGISTRRRARGPKSLPRSWPR